MSDKVDEQIQASMQNACNMGVDQDDDFSRLHIVRRTCAWTITQNKPQRSSPGSLLTTALNSLSSSFDSFLKVLHPQRPGTAEDVQELIFTFPTTYISESSGAILIELTVVFQYALKEYKREQDERKVKGLES